MPAKRPQKTAGRRETAEEQTTTDQDEDAGESAWSTDWGAGWGALTSIRASVQRAAATAAGDITQLTASFQQALREMADEPDDEPPREAGAAQAAEGAAAPDPASEATAPAEALSPGQQAKREAVLARLHGAPTSSDRLLARLHVVDQGVDRVAQEATAALSSLWGAVRARAAEGGGLLGSLRAQTESLLAEVAGGDPDPSPPRRQPRGAPDLEGKLFVYGGTQAVEELQTLSAESSRLASRAGVGAGGEPGGELVPGLAQLSELLTVADEGRASGQGEAAAVEELEAATGLGRRDRGLRAGHALVEDVADAAVQRLGRGTAGDAAGARAGRAVGDAGVKALAEVTSACLERMLALAKSVLHSAREARPSDDRVAWPATAELVAASLHRELLLLLQEVRRVSAACPECHAEPEAESAAPCRAATAAQCESLLRDSLPLCAPVVWWARVVRPARELAQA